LGADDGIGCAAMLALLNDAEAKHGPLECLFTVDEETTMGGAERLGKAPFLTANLLINLDSEEEYAICVGCAGGFETHIKLPVHKQAAANAAELKHFEVKVGGLQGGHTGVDIHRGRGNAVKLMAQLLSTAADQAEVTVRLGAFSGGSVINTIPRECDACVAVPAAKAEQFAAQLSSVASTLRSEFSAIESSLEFTVVTVADADAVGALGLLDEVSSLRCVRFLLALPHGPLRMCPGMEHEVESSVSLSIVRLQEDHLLVHPFARASSDFQMQQTYLQLSALAQLCGAETMPRFNGFPGWKPNLEGSTLAAVRKAASQVFPDKTIRTYSIHAGLECGLIIGNYPTMVCVCCGEGGNVAVVCERERGVCECECDR
jgi:dipeptidase D